jgi:Lar family restriction alleviation protein
MGEELKPCAHCGSTSVSVWHSGRTNWNVTCEDCSITSGFHTSRAAAIAAWNRRVLPDREVVVRVIDEWEYGEGAPGSGELRGPIVRAVGSPYSSAPPRLKGADVICLADRILALLEGPVVAGESNEAPRFDPNSGSSPNPNCPRCNGSGYEPGLDATQCVECAECRGSGRC